MKLLLLNEVLRFCFVGSVAVIVQYVVYYFGIKVLSHTPAFVIGYFMSFAVNYALTTSFTFKTQKSVKNGFGFTLCHIVNFFLQIALLNIFIYWGLNKQLAPVPVFIICVPVNFFLVRLTMKKL